MIFSLWRTVIHWWFPVASLLLATAPCVPVDRYNRETHTYEQWCAPNTHDPVVNEPFSRHDALHVYAKGGQYPMVVGQRFNETVQIVERLHIGPYCSVWLTNTDQVMKIFRADQRSMAIRSVDVQRNVSSVLLPLLDATMVQSPFGTHAVLFYPRFGNGYTAQNGPTGVYAAKRVAACVLDALVHLHNNGVVHGNVEPTNVLWGDNWACALGGMAQVQWNREHGTQTPVHTDPRYQSPEVMSGIEPTMRPADIWSLACVVYRVATGKALFSRKGIVSTELPAVDTGDSALDAFILDGLRWMPEERPRVQEWRDKHALFYFSNAGL